MAFIAGTFVYCLLPQVEQKFKQFQDFMNPKEESETAKSAQVRMKYLKENPEKLKYLNEKFMDLIGCIVVAFNVSNFHENKQAKDW